MNIEDLTVTAEPQLIGIVHGPGRTYRREVWLCADPVADYKRVRDHQYRGRNLHRENIRNRHQKNHAPGDKPPDRDRAIAVDLFAARDLYKQGILKLGKCPGCGEVRCNQGFLACRDRSERVVSSDDREATQAHVNSLPPPKPDLGPYPDDVAEIGSPVTRSILMGRKPFR